MGAFEPFQCPGPNSGQAAGPAERWRGEVRSRWLAADSLCAAVELLTDPGAACETLHWGRNYLYRTTVRTAQGEQPVVVKQFRNQSRRARWKRRHGGSRAERSWHAAAALEAAGVRTPKPLLLIESEQDDGASYYVTELEENFLESRYYFRALATNQAEEKYPEIGRSALMNEIGRLFARVHSGRVWHRDLSIGNILIRSESSTARPELTLIDLDRCRLGRELSTFRRLRDICRLPILIDRDRRDFWQGYWGSDSSLESWKGRVFRLLQAGFLAKNRWKPRLRRPFKAIRELAFSRRPYAHIPDPPSDAAIRDKAVWDQLSDQPHQHAKRSERAAIRAADAGAHVEAFWAAASAAPRILGRYRALASESQAKPLDWAGTGISVRPLPGFESELIGAISDLGVRHVFLRLHPWQSEHDAEEELARALSERGYELAFGLPQNRDLVRDPDRWQAAVGELAERFRPFGRHFQVGQAINRSKWGLWNYREYLELAVRAREALSAHEGIRLLGPAVIDFEYQATAAVLNMKRADAYFDIVSALLYVDRRGAPENKQLGFDTLGKCALLRAIAETSRNSGSRCWITETNWPLWEGPHSPAGRTVSVDEETQADYLARYYLLALTSGHVERVYWWQLAARGYGLLDPVQGSLRRRPSFLALATLERELSGMRFVRAWSPSAGTRVLAFERDNASKLVAWCLGPPEAVSLDQEFRRAVSRDGFDLQLPPGRKLELSSSPVYLDLAIH